MVTATLQSQHSSELRKRVVVLRHINEVLATEVPPIFLCRRPRRCAVDGLGLFATAFNLFPF